MYRFGLFEFDPASNELTSEGRRVPLEPQPARALALLLSRAGEVVTRDEMRDCLWGADTHVDFDRGLGYCIGALRSALRDRADNPRFIETLPRRGYRFIAPVTRAARNGDRPHLPTVRNGDRPHLPAARNGDRPHSRRRTALRWLGLSAIATLVAAAGVWTYGRRSQPSRPIVAVAVFDNETGDARHDRFVQGVSDVVVDRLTAIGPERVGVIGNMPELRRTRAERNLTAMATETRAAFIIIGQLQTRNGGLSLLIQLIRVSDGTHVWVQRIARPAGDALVGVDEQAARMLEGAVREHALGERRTS